MEIAERRFTKLELESHLNPSGTVGRARGAAGVSSGRGKRVRALYAQVAPLLAQHSAPLSALRIREMTQQATFAQANLLLVRSIKVKDDGSEQRTLGQLTTHLKTLEGKALEHRDEYLPVIDFLVTALEGKTEALGSTEGGFRIPGTLDMVEPIVCQALSKVPPSGEIADLTSALKSALKSAEPLLSETILEDVESKGWPTVLAGMDAAHRDRLLKIHGLARVVIEGHDITQMDAGAMVTAFGASLCPPAEDQAQAGRYDTQLQALFEAGEFAVASAPAQVAPPLPPKPAAAAPEQPQRTAPPVPDAAPAATPPTPEETGSSRGMLIGGGVTVSLVGLAALIYFNKLDPRALANRIKYSVR